MIGVPVAEKPGDDTSPGRLRALYDWVTRVAPSPPASPSRAIDPPPADLPARIGHYAIARKLGQGGMGVVYAARDERLERTVALKTIASRSTDEAARHRFWREARAAASVNHPNVCQIYEIGEDRGELFIAMELLEGEALGERLRRGPLSVSETVPIGLEVLAALQALHARGIVHRDLKPSNVFLTLHGVKLLDFGLARPSEPDLGRSLGTAAELTRTGMMMGTPRYMAPEQVTGEALDARTDLFAAGAILFEMLAGRPAFGGRNLVEILHATLYEQPPALTGSPAVAAADRVIRRALAKRPTDRPASAEVMAEELRAVRGTPGEGTPALARVLTRLVVLPFRVLRPDPETDFLAFSLPDAGLARTPPRGHVHELVRFQRAQDHGRPRGGLPGGRAAVRRGRARRGSRPSASSRRPGLLQAREPGQRPAAADHRQVDRALRSTVVARRPAPHPAGDRSGGGRYEAG